MENYLRFLSITGGNVEIPSNECCLLKMKFSVLTLAEQAGIKVTTGLQAF
jgi:hypothetical protein